ncbi:hypothetical protein M8494_10150 [Serratia ureilytica]
MKSARAKGSSWCLDKAAAGQVNAIILPVPTAITKGGAAVENHLRQSVAGADRRRTAGSRDGDGGRNQNARVDRTGGRGCCPRWQIPA